MAMASLHRTRAQQQKRHGKHQKRTKQFLHVYHPYLPLVMASLLFVVLHVYWQPHRQISQKGVLAYATNMSPSGLLQATNQQRQSNGRSLLTLNSQLSQAAQAKANDMASRNYWSHNTPEGNAPWVFIAQAGYSYTQAGENLAYGFLTSDDAVVGWMNSPSHRDNLLNTAFLDVGFGFANNPDYQGSGPETVVVAMYGTPQVKGATTPATPSTPTKTSTTSPTAPTTHPQTNQSASPAPAPTAPTSPTPSSSDTKNAKPAEVINTTNNESTAAAGTKRVSRLEVLTRGAIPWVSTVTLLVTITLVTYLGVSHAVAIRRVVVRGERYFMHHVAFDLTLVVVLAICYELSHTAGLIR